MKAINKKYRYLFALVILSSSISAICIGIFSIQLGSVFDLIRQSDQEYFGKIYLCIFILLNWLVFSTIFEYTKTNYGKEIILAIKKRVIQSYFSKKISNKNMRRQDEYLNHLVQNISIYWENNIIPKCDLISNSVSVGVSLVIIFGINWKMALTFIIVSVISILVSQLPGKFLTNKTNEMTSESQNYLRVTTTLLKSYEQSKLLQIENFIKDKFQKANHNFENTRKLYYFSKESSQIFSQFISFSSQMLCMVIGIYFIRIGQLSLGDLIASIQLLNGVFSPLQSLLHQKNQINATKEIYHKFSEILDIDSNEIVNEKSVVIETLSFQDITMSLNSKVLFDNFSYTFSQNNRYAIIGDSGCGKTTLGKMILGYFEKSDYQGKIMINNNSVEKINPSNLYGSIGFVGKNDLMISSTVEDNIILGRSELLQNLEEVTKKMRLPSDLLKKTIRHDKNDISLGEKQRIDISRVLIKNYQVYIFDEPTSNLDPENAANIMDYILDIRDAIVIVITHDQRKELLQKFDYVINLNNS
ncbi:ATP-binding cassette domain-containing protein [Streptococcus didelphis]|nr:ABC transporter ATP-binding protein [Streptococcus didelphis]